MLQPRPSSSLKIQLAFLFGILAFMAVIFIAGSLKPKAQANKTGVLIFSQARSIQPFYLDKQLFSQKNFKQRWTFLFFGFTHCSEVCPTTLTELNEAYQALHARYPNLQVVFVSIDPEHEQTAELQRYSAAFNKNFIGLSGTPEQLKTLKQQFGIVAERDEHGGAAAINHTSSIFLIDPEGQWTAVFPYGLRAKQISIEFERIANNNSFRS